MHALLVVSKEPLSANDMAQALNISRGNVSMGLKELQSWGLVQMHHVPGDRKDYFTSLGSIWEMANKVFEQRRKREMDPTLSLLRDLLLDSAANEQEQYAQQRLQEILQLLESITAFSEELQRMSPEKLNTLMKLGSGMTKVLDIKDKLLKSS